MTPLDQGSFAAPVFDTLLSGQSPQYATTFIKPHVHPNLILSADRSQPSDVQRDGITLSVAGIIAGLDPLKD